jgi:hypothetical protein
MVADMEASEISHALFTSAGDPYPHYADLLAGGEAFHLPAWSSVFVAGYSAIEAVLRDPVFEVHGSTWLDERGYGITLAGPGLRVPGPAF